MTLKRGHPSLVIKVRARVKRLTCISRKNASSERLSLSSFGLVFLLSFKLIGISITENTGIQKLNHSWY